MISEFQSLDGTGHLEGKIDAAAGRFADSIDRIGIRLKTVGRAELPSKSHLLRR